MFKPKDLFILISLFVFTIYQALGAGGPFPFSRSLKRDSKSTTSHRTKVPRGPKDEIIQITIEKAINNGEALMENSIITSNDENSQWKDIPENEAQEAQNRPELEENFQHQTEYSDDLVRP